MENELCRSRTTRWADVEAEEDDLDMSLPIEKIQISNSSTTNAFSTEILVDKDKVDAARRKYNRQDNNGKADNISQSNQGNHVNSTNKRNLNLPKEAPFLARISNLDYSLQLRDIQDFFRSKGIINIKIKLPTRNGNNEGVATVEFEKFEEFSNFVNNLDGSCIGSRNIRVNVVSQKNRLEDRMSHRNNNMIRSTNTNINPQSSHNHSQTQSLSSNQNTNYARNKIHHSNRDASPDFSIVRRTNVTSKSEEMSNKPGNAGINSVNEDNKSAKLKNNSKSRNRTNEIQSSCSINDSGTSNVDLSGANSSSKGFNRNPSNNESERNGNKRWNFTSQKEKGRFRFPGEGNQYRNAKNASKGGNNVSSKSSSNNLSHSNTDKTDGNVHVREYNNNGNVHTHNNGNINITRNSNNREVNETKKGRGYHNNHKSNVKSSLEGKLASGSESQTLGPKGNNIETRNRFAALDES